MQKNVVFGAKTIIPYEGAKSHSRRAARVAHLKNRIPELNLMRNLVTNASAKKLRNAWFQKGVSVSHTKGAGVPRGVPKIALKFHHNVHLWRPLLADTLWYGHICRVMWLQQKRAMTFRTHPSQKTQKTWF